ncbi:hypothetical protein MNBD_ALPHA07-2070, partial [hydrothermal vent metagenome]
RLHTYFGASGKQGAVQFACMLLLLVWALKLLKQRVVFSLDDFQTCVRCVKVTTQWRVLFLAPG